MTVAPVVVKPDVASNRESTRLKCGPRTNGSAPAKLNTIQNNATMRNPSRRRNSPELCLKGVHNSVPTASRPKNAATNTICWPSWNHRDTRIGGSIVMLPAAHRMPTIFST